MKQNIFFAITPGRNHTTPLDIAHTAARICPLWDGVAQFAHYLAQLLATAVTGLAYAAYPIHFSISEAVIHTADRDVFLRDLPGGDTAHL